MNTKYLVTLCCSMDEVPVRLFDTEGEVRRFCLDTLPIGSRDDRWTSDHPAAVPIAAYDCDFSCVLGWNCFKVVNGVPVAKRNLWSSPEKGEQYPHDSLSAEGMATYVPDGPLFPKMGVERLNLYYVNALRERFTKDKPVVDAILVTAATESEVWNVIANHDVGRDTVLYGTTNGLVWPRTSADATVRLVGQAPEGAVPEILEWVSV